MTFNYQFFILTIDFNIDVSYGNAVEQYRVYTRCNTLFTTFIERLLFKPFSTETHSFNLYRGCEGDGSCRFFFSFVGKDRCFRWSKNETELGRVPCT